MNKYFYSDGQQSFGPYGLAELRSMNVVSPSTKVWCQGMVDWVDASTVAEMGDWFATTPPPVKVVIQGNERHTIEIHASQAGGQTISEQIPPIPFSWLAPAIIVTVLCCCGMPFSIVGIVYAAKVEGRYGRGDYAGAKSAANMACIWTWIGFGSGLLSSLCYTFFVGITNS